MKTTQNKTHRDYNDEMIHTYPIEVSPLSEEGGSGFQALFPPLARSVVGYGMTVQEAIADLQTMVPSLLEAMAETEQVLPEVAAEKEWDDFSGKFNVRVAKALHAQLVELAEEQGVSLNSLVQTILASGATALTAGKMFGAVERTDTGYKVRDSWHQDTLMTAALLVDKSLIARQNVAGERTIDSWLSKMEN